MIRKQRLPYENNGHYKKKKQQQQQLNGYINKTTITIREQRLR